MAEEDYPSPDIIQLGTTWTAYFAHLGVLADLTEEIDPDNYFDSSIASCRINNSRQLYAIPWFVDVRVLYYWRDILEEAGIRNPQEYLRDWQGFRDACRSIQNWIQTSGTTTIKKAFGIPIKRNWDLLHELAIWIWAGGGDILKDKKAAFHEKDALRAIDFLLNLKNMGCLDLPKIDLDEIEKKFVSREYAMIIGRTRVIERLSEEEDRIGITLPPMKKKRVTFVGGSNLALLRSSENFDEALKLIKFLTGGKVLTSYTKAIGMPPAVKGAITYHFENDTLRNRFREALECGRSYPSISEWARIVERERTLTSFYSIWRHIAEERFPTDIHSELETMAKSLNRDLTISILKNLLSSRIRILRLIGEWLSWILGHIIKVLITLGALAAGLTVVREIWKWYIYRKQKKKA
jgi:multiple sugar transport system substrate-binding protein